MGNRIYKQLGWGLADLQEDERGYTDDSRINSEALLHRMELGPEYLEHIKNLCEMEEEASGNWFDLKMISTMIEEDLKKDGMVRWPITHSGEPCQGKVLLIQPPGFNRWTQYNNAIDNAEESLRSDWGNPRTTLFQHGIFPFVDLYMDSRTGRHLDTKIVAAMKNCIDHPIDKDTKKRLSRADRLAQFLGFENLEEANQHVAPRVPPDIRYFCDWANLFTGPDIWLQLRPMLYVHWS